MQIIVTLSKLITPPAMLQCLKFIYTGSIDKECSNLKVSSSIYSRNKRKQNIRTLLFKTGDEVESNLTD